MSALALAQPVAATTGDGFHSDALKLESFARIPPGFDVVPLSGMAAVFNPKWSDIIEGRYYVVESQQPTGGMSWHLYDEHVLRCDRDGSPRTLLKTTRRVVQAIRRENTGTAWWFVHESGFSDGPIKDWAVGHNIVGEVVGIYQPA